MQEKSQVEKILKKFQVLQRPAFFVWPQSFQDFGRQELSGALGAVAPEVTFSQRDIHFLPPCLTVENLKLRELLLVADRVRGATEIWLRLMRQRTPTKGEIRQVVAGYPWKHWLGPGTRVNITAECQKSSLRNANELRSLIAQVLEQQDCLVSAPQESELRGSVPLKVSLFRDTLSLYAPLTFEPRLHQNYKSQLFHPASLREDLAQCLVKEFFDWQQSFTPKDPVAIQNLYLPFFGSGTFCFESISFFLGIGHTLLGTYGSFESSLLTPKKTLRHLQGLSQKRAEATAEKTRIFVLGLDTNKAYLEKFAKNNSSFLDLLPRLAQESIEIQLRDDDFFETKAEHLSQALCDQVTPGNDLVTPVTVFLNPPFGQRVSLGSDSSPSPDAQYQRIGLHLRELSRRRTLQGMVVCPDQKTCESLQKGFSFEPFTQPHHSKVVSMSYGTLEARVFFFFIHPNVAKD